MSNKLTKRQKQESHFLQTLIDMANETHLVDFTFGQVKEGFAKAEIVVGLWPVGDDYGYMPLKGADLLKRSPTPANSMQQRSPPSFASIVSRQ